CVNRPGVKHSATAAAKPDMTSRCAIEAPSRRRMSVLVVASSIAGGLIPVPRNSTEGSVESSNKGEISRAMPVRELAAGVQQLCHRAVDLVVAAFARVLEHDLAVLVDDVL